jgi:hypothetical protein
MMTRRKESTAAANSDSRTLLLAFEVGEPRRTARIRHIPARATAQLLEEILPVNAIHARLPRSLIR